MTRLARAIAFVAAVGVAGLSSPLAICVAACTERNRATPAAHECHKATTPESGMQADSGACSHTPASADGVTLARDPHPTIVTAAVVMVTATRPRHHVLAALARGNARVPARPVTSPPVLRI